MSVSVKKWGFLIWGKAIIHGENTPEFMALIREWNPAKNRKEIYARPNFYKRRAGAQFEER